MLTSSRNVQYFTCLGFNPIWPAVFRALETRTKERSNRVVPLPPLDPLHRSPPWNCSNIFSIKVFFHGHWRLTGQQEKRGNHLLFHSITSTLSRTSRHLFVTLHLRWLSYIFNCIACLYQNATWWDFPPSRITIWLINDVTLVFLCLFTSWFDSSFFVTAIWKGNRWIRTLVDYHLCITSEPTNQVC